LVDTLHEDLNRIKTKPYVEVPDSEYRDDSIVSAEHWDAFTARNKSVIVDLMYGQLKSRLRCKECDNESNTFDPFLAMSVPIPKASKSKVTVTYFPENLLGDNKIKELKIEMIRTDTAKDLATKIKTKVGADETQKLHMMRVNRWGDIFKKLDLNTPFH
jgi:ubiquitin C-terminal hydrolase